jgi:hypothetical protein
VGYVIVFPIIFKFLTQYQVSQEITNQISLNSYMGIFLMMIFVMGLVFEMPVLAWLLSKLGVLTKSFLKKYRKHAVVILLALAAVPLFWILDTGDTSLIRFGIIVCLGGIYPMMYGPQPALYSSQFPASIRYSGISLCVQGAAAIGGGLAPIIATSLLSATEGTTAVGLYLGALGLLAATCCGLLRSPATDEISSR